MLVCCEIMAYVEEYVKQLTALSGKPSYQWGRASTVTVSTWLDNNAIPSNKTGIPFGLNNGLLSEIWVGNEDLVAYDITLYWHLGNETSLTALTTVSVTAGARTKTFNVSNFGVVSIPKDVQLATRVTAVPGANPKNVSIHATILGTT